MLLLFEMNLYIKNHRKRICVVIAFLLFTAMFSKRNVANLLELYELMPQGASLSFLDYLVGIFNSAQFVMFFIFPLLFAILVADMVTKDFDEGLIVLLLSRGKNRFQYISTKCLAVFIGAIFFTCLVILSALLVGGLFQLPFAGETFHYLFSVNEGSNQFMMYMIVISSFVLGLTLIGLLTLTISVYSGSAGVAIGFIIGLSFLHNILYVIGSPFLIWLPFTQYIVGLHSIYAPYGIPVSYFTSAFSSVYLFIGICFMIFLLIRKFLFMDINQLRSES